MKGKSRFNSRNLATFVTIGLFILMFGAGSVAFTGFFSMQNFLNLFIDNAYLLIMATGMTFVIISGGIDLSVGSVLALSTMLSSSLLTKSHMHPGLVIPIVLLMGTTLGFFMGYMIHNFAVPPFIITLAGLYLARGLCYVVSIDTIAINDSFFKWASEFRVNIIGGNSLSVSALLALAVVLVGFFMMRYTKFGRTIYAIGGNEQSALLMGLPVASTKIAIYSLSGFCSALAGIVFTFYTLSGYALNGKSMEMDSIASVVIGGTLLTGGVGNLVGTVFGVLVYGIIQTLIMFQGTLNSWWTRIVIGFLVFLFCFLQRIFEARGVVKAQKAAPKAVPEKS
jgi:ribose/xylose/arabinose/galactoside ABC-type transport system permease subunit